MNIPQHLQQQRTSRFLSRLLRAMEALPGVVSVGGTTRVPLGSTSVSTTVQIEGRPVPAAELPEVQFRRAMHNYFETMGIPIRKGRNFDANDTPTAPPVAVINETMARKLFANQEPLGQHVRTGPNPSGTWTTIIGVIGDVRHGGLEEVPQPEMYISYLQGPPSPRSSSCARRPIRRRWPRRSAPRRGASTRTCRSTTCGPCRRCDRRRSRHGGLSC
jgi:hypothetical protein